MSWFKRFRPEARQPVAPGFERFFGAFRVTQRGDPAPWAANVQPGWTDLLDEFGGSTFERGLYRLHTPQTAARANEAVGIAHPDLVGDIECFGFDWLGRQFGVMRGEPLAESVRMIEPGTAEVLIIPRSFADFHNLELVEDSDPALASAFFRKWAAVNSRSLPLAANRCLGYQIPLFLGGKDDLSNLEVVDLDVYWAISAQLIAQTRGLPPGTSISRITIE